MFFFQSLIRKLEKTHFVLLRLAVVFFITFSRAASAANFYTNYSPVTVPWPGGIVPYEFTNTLTAAQQQTYLAGLREWELAGNVKFVPHTNQPNWILFSYNTNFLDHVSGGSLNPQQVTVSSLSRAQVGHEMGHSFGFNHENIRIDATNYIIVLTNNIVNEPANIGFFTVDPTTFPYGSYDFESVMHLGWDFDSTNPGVAPTMQPKPPYFPRYQFRLGNFTLSPGDRAALAHLYGPPAVPLTNSVTTTADVGPGSLRAAMYYVADHPGAMVSFNIPTSDPGYSNGVFTIHLTGQLPTLASNAMVIDGSTQPGFTGKPLIIVDASQIIPETFTSDTLLIYSANNQIKNISLQGFNWNGVTLLYADATNNTIAGCWIGLAATGTNAAPNAFQGILIASGANRNIIGGTNTLARNVISGNAQYGIWMSDSNTTGNVVLGNYLGTDASGSNAAPNGLSGVLIGNRANGNIIGSTNAAGRNLLSGNLQFGVFITDSNTANNIILGNYIGTDVSGTKAIANGLTGLKIVNGAHNNLIGGTVTGAGNVLSGNGEYGVAIVNDGTTGNLVQGNLIGLGAGGTNGVPNVFSGLLIDSGAQSNIIGGTVTGARNIISGNITAGVFLTGAGTSDNVVEGNYIGTDITGTNAIGNTIAGIYLPGGAQNNIIGGTIPAARNVISGNASYGVYLLDPSTSGNLVEGNYIGVTPDGAHALGNGFAGVIIFGGATNNTIGGGPGAGNVVSGNFSYGFYLRDSTTAGNWIQGNNVGTDATGLNALPNSIGFIIFAGATNNLIGLKPDGSGNGNEIAFNFGDGVRVGDVGTAGIAIRGNSMFSNGGLGIDLLNNGNNLQNFPVITNAFGLGGSTVVLGNFTNLANRTFLVDVYRSLAADLSGRFEGQFYVGTVSVTTDGSGHAGFSLTNNTANYAGQYFTATATSASGDTSEFSSALLAANVPVPFAQFTGNFSWSSNKFNFTLNLQTNFSYHIQANTNLANALGWVNLTNFTATNSIFNFIDRAATNQVRFYRVVSP
jgi:Astacin (Peptidase family M12A)